MDGYKIAFRCIETMTTRECRTTSWTNQSVNSTGFRIKGLPSWTKYEIRIKGYDKVGESPENVTFATTLETGMFLLLIFMGIILFCFSEMLMLVSSKLDA